MRLWLKRGADAVGVGLFAALFLNFILQITARFVFDRPLPWTDELAVVLYIWVILWAAAFMVPAKEHVMFDLAYSLVGKRVKHAMLVLGSMMIGALAAYALPGSWDYVRFMGREGTPVLNLPFSLVFLPFVLLLIALVVRNILQIAAVWRGRSGEID